MDKLKDTGISRGVELLKRKSVTLSLVLTLMGFVVQGNKESVTAQTTNPESDRCVTPINNNTINLRSGPGTNFSIEDLLNPDEILKLESEGMDGWKLIKNQSGDQLFVKGDLVREENCEELTQDVLSDNSNLLNLTYREVEGVKIFGESQIDLTTGQPFITDEQIAEISNVIREYTKDLPKEHTFNQYPLSVVFTSKEEAIKLDPRLASYDTWAAATTLVKFNGNFLTDYSQAGETMTALVIYTDQGLSMNTFSDVVHEIAHSEGMGHFGFMNAYDIGKVASFAASGDVFPNVCRPTTVGEDYVQFCIELAKAKHGRYLTTEQ